MSAIQHRTNRESPSAVNVCRATDQTTINEPKRRIFVLSADRVKENRVNFALTRAARASQKTHGHSAVLMADTCAATAPSKAQKRNRSSRCGKCSHMERDFRRQVRMGFCSICSSGSSLDITSDMLRLHKIGNAQKQTKQLR